MDNGPKDGDFASYVEELSRRHPAVQAQHDADFTRDESSDQVGRSPAAPWETPYVHARHSVPAGSNDGSAGPVVAAAAGTPQAAHHPTTRVTDLPEPLRRIADHGEQLRDALGVDLSSLASAGRWLMRVVAIGLIAWGILAWPLSVVPIAFGIFLLVLSAR